MREWDDFYHLSEQNIVLGQADQTSDHGGVAQVATAVFELYQDASAY